MRQFFSLKESDYEGPCDVGEFATFLEAVQAAKGAYFYIEGLTSDGIKVLAQSIYVPKQTKKHFAKFWDVTDDGKALGIALEPHDDRTYIISIIKGSVEGEVEAQDAVEAWARFCSNVEVFPKPA